MNPSEKYEITVLSFFIIKGTENKDITKRTDTIVIPLPLNPLTSKITSRVIKDIIPQEKSNIPIEDTGENRISEKNFIIFLIKDI